MDGSVTCTEVVRDHVRIGADAHRVGAPTRHRARGCAHGRRTAMTGLGRFGAALTDRSVFGPISQPVGRSSRHSRWTIPFYRTRENSE
jgi:hypothetical protein